MFKLTYLPCLRSSHAGTPGSIRISNEKVLEYGGDGICMTSDEEAVQIVRTHLQNLFSVEEIQAPVEVVIGEAVPEVSLEEEELPMIEIEEEELPPPPKRVRVGGKKKKK